jgi:hypothetical protein
MKNRFLKHASAALLTAAALFTGVSTAHAAGTPLCSTPVTDFQSGTTIALGTQLNPGQHVDAANSTLIMQTDGNLVVYLKTASGQQGPAVWASNTWGAWGAHAIFQNDGNFVVYATDGTAVWSSNTWHLPGAHATLLNEGALVVLGSQSSNSDFASGGMEFKSQYCPLQGSAYNGAPAHYTDGLIYGGGTLQTGDWLDSPNAWLVFRPDGDLAIYRKRDSAVIWESSTGGHPYMSARMQSDGNFVVVQDGYNLIGSTNTSGHPGAYAIFQTDGNFVVYDANGNALWSSGTWQTANQ